MRDSELIIVDEPSAGLYFGDRESLIVNLDPIAMSWFGVTVHPDTGRTHGVVGSAHRVEDDLRVDGCGDIPDVNYRSPGSQSGETTGSEQQIGHDSTQVSAPKLRLRPLGSSLVSYGFIRGC